MTNACEVVDKILYRSDAFIKLTARRYNDEHSTFLDPSGEALSDHYPLTVQFDWSLSDRIRMSDQFGGPHGVPFNDLSRLTGSAAVDRISLRGGSRLDRVEVALADGTLLAHGGGGTAAVLQLAAGEHLTQITLTRGKHNNLTRIFSAQLGTDWGRTVSAGVPTSDRITYQAPAGWQIVGFTGRSGDEIDKLGVIYMAQ